MTRSRNVVPRAQLREGAVECPLCGRQIAAPTERLVAFGVVEQLTPETADAVECPACNGVTFVDDAPAADGDRGEVNGVDVKRDDAMRDDTTRDDAMRDDTTRDDANEGS